MKPQTSCLFVTVVVLMAWPALSVAQQVKPAPVNPLRSGEVIEHLIL